MGIFSRSKSTADSNRKKKFYKKRWFKILLVILILGAATGGWAMYKAGATLSKISTKDGFFSSLWKSIPGVASDKLQGQDQGQINVLLLGMRGNNMPGGGLLADSIMVAAIRPQENKVALISIPRDLYVSGSGIVQPKQNKCRQRLV